MAGENEGRELPTECPEGHPLGVGVEPGDHYWCEACGKEYWVAEEW